MELEDCLGQVTEIKDQTVLVATRFDDFEKERRKLINATLRASEAKEKKTLCDNSLRFLTDQFTYPLNEINLQTVREDLLSAFEAYPELLTRDDILEDIPVDELFSKLHRKISTKQSRSTATFQVKEDKVKEIDCSVKELENQVLEEMQVLNNVITCIQEKCENATSSVLRYVDSRKV